MAIRTLAGTPLSVVMVSNLVLNSRPDLKYLPYELGHAITIPIFRQGSGFSLIAGGWGGWTPSNRMVDDPGDFVAAKWKSKIVEGTHRHRFDMNVHFVEFRTNNDRNPRFWALRSPQDFPKGPVAEPWLDERYRRLFLDYEALCVVNRIGKHWMKSKFTQNARQQLPNSRVSAGNDGPRPIPRG